MQDTDTAEPEPEPEKPDPNVELIRESARLFLRNLAYDVTDADLEPIFAPFGKLDEVCNTLPTPFSHPPIHPLSMPSCAIVHALAECSNDDYPDRDSLCKSK